MVDLSIQSGSHPSASRSVEGEAFASPLRNCFVDMALGRAPRDRLDAFLAMRRPAEILDAWFGSSLRAFAPSALAGAIDRDISFLDDILSEQLNALLHHRRFKALEASWRGVAYLCRSAASASSVLVKVLNVSWAELAQDFAYAGDIEDCALFAKVYSYEFGMPGGQPFGVLLCDYQIRHRLTSDHPIDDVGALAALSGVAAAAFAPAVLSVSPSMLGVDSFAELDRLRSLGKVFRNEEYRRFEQLRRRDDSRFLALVLPRILMREPYFGDSSVSTPFRYREDLHGLAHEDHCWGSAIYALGEVLIRSFDLHGWFADICGARQDEIDHGIVAGAVCPSMDCDNPGVAPRIGSELVISTQLENELNEAGFINLNVCKDTSLLGFRSTPSIQTPLKYNNMAGTSNARLSAMLRYILCVSRFAHYIKVQVRDKVGSYTTEDACERSLQRWLSEYSIANDDASVEMKARYPLREGRVEVKEIPGRPGSFACVMHLRPHYQVDDVFTTFKLVTDIALGEGNA